MWKGDGRPDRRQQLFGGEGEVRVWTLSGQVPAPFEVVLGCELAPSGVVGTHVQERCAEVLIVTEGHGEAWVDGSSMRLGPGATLSLPLGSSLKLRNRSAKTVLRYLIIKAASQ